MSLAMANQVALALDFVADLVFVATRSNRRVVNSLKKFNPLFFHSVYFFSFIL
jgi:hypothetical protein